MNTDTVQKESLRKGNPYYVFSNNIHSKRITNDIRSKTQFMKNV